MRSSSFSNHCQFSTKSSAVFWKDSTIQWRSVFVSEVKDLPKKASLATNLLLFTKVSSKNQHQFPFNKRFHNVSLVHFLRQDLYQIKNICKPNLWLLEKRNYISLFCVYWQSMAISNRGTLWEQLSIVKWSCSRMI